MSRDKTDKFQKFEMADSCLDDVFYFNVCNFNALLICFLCKTPQLLIRQYNFNIYFCTYFLYFSYFIFFIFMIFILLFYMLLSCFILLSFYSCIALYLLYCIVCCQCLPEWRIIFMVSIELMWTPTKRKSMFRSQTLYTC